MASTKEYLDFVPEQLSGMDEISSRAMMGEYIRSEKSEKSRIHLIRNNGEKQHAFC